MTVGNTIVGNTIAAHKLARPARLATFAIGSLPHTQQELALQQALRLDIPTLPQLPREDAAEYMLPQALEQLPGLIVDSEGRTTVDLAKWADGARALDERLDRALAGADLEAFEPSGTACRSWKPFLWEIEQRKAKLAKAQIAGPLTSSWATNVSTGAPLSNEPKLAAQVVRLVTARALAMAAAIRATGATPMIFLDEPGLYAFDKRRPSHLLELRELSFVAAALRKEGALVGVHCCGNTDWAGLFGLPLDFVSADVRLSLSSMLATGDAIDRFFASGGWLALGIIPTNVPGRVAVDDLVDDALALMGDRRADVLSRSILSPACGLALRTVVESEEAYDDLREAQRLLQNT